METITEKRRRARAAWTWTPARRAKASATRKRLMRAGKIPSPPSSLGGRACTAKKLALYKDVMPPEARQRQIETQRRQFASGERTIAPQTREAVRQSNLRRKDEIIQRNKQPWPKERRQKLSETRKRKFASGELIVSPATRAKLSTVMKGRPVPWAAYMRNSGWVATRTKAARRGACQQPNRLEAKVMTFLDQQFPLEWRYNIADIVVGGKIPDFIRKDSIHICIDVFGDFWHRGEHPNPRQQHFRGHGYDLVVIWEHEFKRDPNILTRRVRLALRKVRGGMKSG